MPMAGLPPDGEIDAVVDRVAVRCPDVARSRVVDAVDRAVGDLAHARVQQFLPILIERIAVSHLRGDIPAPVEDRP